MKFNLWLKGGIAVMLCELAGILGGVFTASSVRNWYPTLLKPSFNPPSWVFGPVWTALYAMMGISFAIIWEKGIATGDGRRAALLFGAQLVLNVLWSALFFGLKRPWIAFIEIIILWLAIAATIAAFWTISKPAAYLLLPYIAWVTFAAALNLRIAMLN